VTSDSVLAVKEHFFDKYDTALDLDDIAILYNDLLLEYEHLSLL
jgi:hypothetical protein